MPCRGCIRSRSNAGGNDVNVYDVLILAAVGAALVLAVVGIRRNKGGCCGSCEGCTRACSRKEK